MFCSQCGAKIDESSKYCSVCGTKLDPSASAASSQERPASTAQTVKKKPMPLWFKILTALAVLALIGVTAGILFTEKLVDVIDKQLEALRKDDIDKAYHAYTSKEFQTATSLDQFRHFVQTYPVFLDNQSAHFNQRSIENNISTLKGNLTSQDHVNTPIEYKLIKEDDKWKILSIRLLKPGKIPPTQQNIHAQQELIEIAKAQLQAIQDNKISDAYQQYTSKEFREATSEKDFQDFVKRYPILHQYQTISFHKPIIRNNGVGTLSAILQSSHIAAYVKYYLIYEDQKWKVWSMRILSPAEESEVEEAEQELSSKNHKETSHKPMSFGDIELGSSVNEGGMIQDPKTVFDSTLKDLYVDLEIKNGIKSSIVYLSLQHLDSGSSIPAKATIEEEGDTKLMSVFSPPASGWPKGHYKLVVTTSSGLNKIIDFDIQ